MQESPLGGPARAESNTTPEQTAAVVSDKIAKRGLSHVEKAAKRLDRLCVEYVSTSDIKPNTYNPNRQDEATLELLKKSMTEDGFTQPVIVHRESRQIVDGEHRWRAARALGMSQIPVVFVEMTDEQMRIATLRHNRARGSEDIELSVEVLRDLQQLGAIDWAQDSLMISDSELNDLLADDVGAAELLAGDEYHDAWVPERGDARQGEMVEDMATSTKVVIQQREGDPGIQAVAMTHDAAADVVARKKALESAPTETERSKVAASLPRPFRLQYVFNNDEADIVQSVLGEEPAERLLEICIKLDSSTSVGE